MRGQVVPERLAGMAGGEAQTDPIPPRRARTAPRREALRPIDIEFASNRSSFIVGRSWFQIRVPNWPGSWFIRIAVCPEHVHDFSCRIRRYLFRLSPITEFGVVPGTASSQHRWHTDSQTRASAEGRTE